jgi:hypothetical protein
LTIALALLIAHGIFCVWNSGSLRRKADVLPKMTCADLLKDGPRGNPYLTLTDVHLAGGGAVFHRDMDEAIEMYVPIYSTRLPREPQPQELKLLLQVLDDRDQERLLEHPDIGDLTCELWTRPGDFDQWMHDGLAAKYPGMPIERCLVLSVGLHEPTPAKAVRSWWFGIESFVAAAVLLACGLWMKRRGTEPRASETSS